MLKPALLYTREITRKFTEHLYTTPTELTPRKAIIKLNRIRTDKGERPPEIDMAIRAINCCMIKRKPVPGDINGRVCPVCGSQWIEDFCANCGQALDWGEGKADG